MRRYTRLFAAQVRSSLLLTMQYRTDFFVNCLTSVFWTASAVVPLLVLYQDRKSVAGWTWPEAMLVVGFFTALKGVLEGVLQPAVQTVVEHIRKGTLDFLLLKPADAQFLVSTTGIELWKANDFLSGLAIIVYALAVLKRLPELGEMALSMTVLVCGVFILYSFLILVVALGFFFIKVDNLTYLIISLYDAGRWPSAIFRGSLALVFTFVLPLSVMTTYPAEALLGRLPPSRMLVAAVVTAAFLSLSRFAWLRSIRHYTSAGG